MLIQRKRLFIYLGILSVVLGIGAGVLAVSAFDVPEVTALEEYRPSATTRLYSDDGGLIAEFYMENRTPVSLAHIPPHVRHAFLAVEDPRFYSHSGIDLIGVMRALFANLRAGKVVQGGSTITQQLTKMLFLEPEKTLTRKVKEAVLSLQIERRYSKDEILNLYLNQVYLGSSAYGVEAAANTYFGKGADRLTLSEAAMLAGMPQAPTRYSPFLNPDRARTRRHHSLERMYDEGYITKEDMEAADKDPLVTRPTRFVSAKAPYFVEYVRQALEEKYGSTTLYRGGLNVYTTLNMKMQEDAEEALAKRLEELTKRHHREGKEVQGAVLAIEPATGQIKAMVGGTDYAKSQFNRATQAHRQPGSAFKPIVYAAAIEKGHSPEDVFVDAPVSYHGASAAARWRPTNYDGKYEGRITLRRALARSVNIIAIKLMDDVGVKEVIDCGRRLGIRSEMPPYLPLALGATDATLMEMTAAYTVFDNKGIYVEPVGIIKIADREGRMVGESTPKSWQAITPDTAATLTDMLTGVIQFGTGFKAKELNRPAAGKTGTTSDFKDAWFIGYLPSLVVGTWVGYDDHKPIGPKETGAVAALPIWLDFMKAYVEEFGVPAESFPPLPPPRPRALENTTGVKPDTGGEGLPEKAYESPDDSAPEEKDRNSGSM